MFMSKKIEIETSLYGGYSNRCPIFTVEPTGKNNSKNKTLENVIRKELGIELPYILSDKYKPASGTYDPNLVFVPSKTLNPPTTSCRSHARKVKITIELL